jgi:hypothetical protein
MYLIVYIVSQAIAHVSLTRIGYNTPDEWVNTLYNANFPHTRFGYVISATNVKNQGWTTGQIFF